MVLPAYFVKPGPAALRDYYVRIGRAIEIPVIIQDAPQLTGVAMNPALWADLAREVETIQYVKAEGVPQGQTLTATLEQSEGRLKVFCGWGGLSMIDAMERGAVGSCLPPTSPASSPRSSVCSKRAMSPEPRHSSSPSCRMCSGRCSRSTSRSARPKPNCRPWPYSDTRTMREPWVHLDQIAEDQLARFIAGREIRDPTDGAARAWGNDEIRKSDAPGTSE